MRTLYLDCGMGAAGDMLTAALFGLTEDPQTALDTLNRAFAGRAVLSLDRDRKQGLEGFFYGLSADRETRISLEKLPFQFLRVLFLFFHTNT